MRVKTAVRGKVLNVLTTGEFSLEFATRGFLEVINAVAENQSEKVLVDGRGVSGDPTIIERFYYGEFAAAAVARSRSSGRSEQDPKFAYVLHEPILDPLRLGETVATNRGMNIKAFDNMEDAIEWLDLAADEVADFDGSRVEGKK